MELTQEVNHLLMSCKDKEHIRSNIENLKAFFSKANNISALKLALTTKKNINALRIIEQLNLKVTPYIYINRYTLTSLFWLNKMGVIAEDEYEILLKKFILLKDFDTVKEKIEKNFIELQIGKRKRKEQKLRKQANMTYVYELYGSKEKLEYSTLEKGNRDTTKFSNRDEEGESNGKSSHINISKYRDEGEDKIKLEQGIDGKGDIQGVDCHSNDGNWAEDVNVAKPEYSLNLCQLDVPDKQTEPHKESLGTSVSHEKIDTPKIVVDKGSYKFKDSVIKSLFSSPSSFTFFFNLDSLIQFDRLIEPFKDFKNQVFKTELKTFEEFPNDPQRIQKINKFKEIKMQLVNSPYRNFSQFFHLCVDTQNKIEDLMRMISRIRKCNFRYYIISKRPLSEVMTFCFLFANSLDLTKIIEISEDGKLPFVPSGKKVTFGEGGVDYAFLKKAIVGLDRFIE